MQTAFNVTCPFTCLSLIEDILPVPLTALRRARHCFHESGLQMPDSEAEGTARRGYKPVQKGRKTGWKG